VAQIEQPVGRKLHPYRDGDTNHRFTLVGEHVRYSSERESRVYPFGTEAAGAVTAGDVMGGGGSVGDVVVGDGAGG
jgi:hypothetical protein